MPSGGNNAPAHSSHWKTCTVRCLAYYELFLELHDNLKPTVLQPVSVCRLLGCTPTWHPDITSASVCDISSTWLCHWDNVVCGVVCQALL